MINTSDNFDLKTIGKYIFIYIYCLISSINQLIYQSIVYLLIHPL